MNFSFSKLSLPIALAFSIFGFNFVAESVSGQCWTEDYGEWESFSDYSFYESGEAFHEYYMPSNSRFRSYSSSWRYESEWDSRFEPDWRQFDSYDSFEGPGCSCDPPPEGCQPGDARGESGGSSSKGNVDGRAPNEPQVDGSNSKDANVSRFDRSIVRRTEPQRRVPTPIAKNEGAGSQNRNGQDSVANKPIADGSENKNRARDVADSFKTDDPTRPAAGAGAGAEVADVKQPSEKPMTEGKVADTVEVSTTAAAATATAEASEAGSGAKPAVVAPVAKSRFPVVNNIRKSALTIYDPLDAQPDLFVQSKELETILDSSMKGLDLDYKLRTRAKVAREEICKALGYPVPDSFKQVRPRFTGQNLDVYVQKSNNLQIWNEDVDVDRRYVIVRVDSDSKVKAVRVLTGKQLYEISTSNTETQKLQAKANRQFQRSTLLTKKDSENFERVSSDPLSRLLPISNVFARLSLLSGREFSYEGNDQERNRGEALHRLVCDRLGTRFVENGQFPDIPDQLLEIKLQTSPTIDLGAVSPDSDKMLIGYKGLKVQDTRYAIFYGTSTGNKVKITRVVLVNGAEFFDHFDRFGGNVTNGKLQVNLPETLFD